SKRRSASASSCPSVPPVLPRWGTVSGSAVGSTERERLPEIDDGGHAPGALKSIRRSSSVLVTGRTLLTPTTQDEVGASSERLSTPCGAYGPSPSGVPVRLRYATALPVVVRFPPPSPRPARCRPP